MKVQRCKGMRDLFPEETSRFSFISGVFRDSCLKWGYDEIKTPTLEYLHLFTSAGTLTPGMLNKVYSFLDWDGWSGERVVLKPDATIPVARMYIESMAEKELAKLCYIANTFIFEQTGKKKREKWQCGAELIGKGSPLADVELIVLALEVLHKLGLNNVEIKLSHAGLTRGFLKNLGLSADDQNKLFDQILDGDAEALARMKAEKPGLANLLALQGKSSGFIKNLAAVLTKDLPELKPQIDDFVTIVDLLQSLGYQYEIDVSSVRGFEYYTGVIFQLFVNEEKIGGGGRYDNLIPSMGGKETPASGFALYMDLLMEMMNPEKPAASQMKKVLIHLEPGTVNEGFAAANALREAGLAAELDLGQKQADSARWRLDISGQPPLFELTDYLKKKKLEIDNIAGVLKTIQKS